MIRETHTLKVLCFILTLASLSSSSVVQATMGPSCRYDAYVQQQSSSDNQIGIGQYPQASYLPEATQRLLETKASTWLLARVYHTDGSINDVTKYFKAQAEKIGKPSEHNDVLRSLLRRNWEIREVTLRGAPSVFGAGTELKGPVSNKRVNTSFGVIVLDDSFVRVHLLSPDPTSAGNEKLTSGTMIVLVKERMPQPQSTEVSQSDTDNEKVYSGRDVTQKAWIKSKPPPESHEGLYGTVILRAVFSSTGKVTNITVLAGPPKLADAVVKAARKISFEPAVKDGRYVSMYIQLEYNFH